MAKITFEKTERHNKWEVFGLPVNGYEWQLIRHKGMGTYASIAGKEEYSEDIEITIEEHSDPEYRKLWDDESLEDVALSAYDIIMDELKDD